MGMKVSRMSRDGLRRVMRDTGLPGIVPALVIATQYDWSSAHRDRHQIVADLWREFRDDNQLIGRFAILLQEPEHQRSRGAGRSDQGSSRSSGSELDRLLGPHLTSGFVSDRRNEVVVLGGVYPEPGYGISLAYESVEALTSVLNTSLGGLPREALALMESANAQRNWGTSTDEGRPSPQVDELLSELRVAALAWKSIAVDEALDIVVAIRSLMINLGSRSSKTDVLERVRRELNWRLIGIRGNHGAIESLRRGRDPAAPAIALDPARYDRDDWPLRHAQVQEQLAALMGDASGASDGQERMDKLRAALAIQAETSQRFLFALEAAARESKRVEPRLVAWDPVRTVAARATRTPFLDEPSLRQRVNDLLVPKDRVEIRGKEGDPVPAALLADLLAFVALNRGVTTRKAAALLLDRLGGRAVLESIQFGAVKQRNTWTEQVEEVLLSVGWPREPDEWVSFHAACSVPEAQLDAATLRRAGEGFVKDVVLLLAHEYVEGGVAGFEAHLKRNPAVEFWGALKDNIEALTLGTALAWLGAVVPVLLLDANQRVLLAELLEALSGLNRLNRHVHDTSDATDSLATLAAHGKRSLDAAVGIFGDMPWRLAVLGRHGTLPTVVTGVGRNHAYAGELPLRLLCADGEETLSEIVIWNPSRQNPVITAGRVLRF